MSLLLINNILIFNKTNYNLLKETFSKLHIKFLEIHKSDFIINLSEYELDAKDISDLILTTELSASEKNSIIEKIDESLISVEMDSIKGIGYLILKHNSFRVSDFILKLILVNKDLTIEQRIRIFYWKHKQVDNEYIDDFLKSLNESYSEITIKGKRPVFKNTEYNLKLIEILDQKNYISKFDFEEKGIRISTYKKDNDS